MPVARKRLVIPAFIITFIIYILFDNIEIDEPPDHPYNHPPPPDVKHDPEEPIHWHQLPQQNPVKSYIKLPNGKPPKPIPKIQYDFPKEDASDRKQRLERQSAVQEAFLHSWKGYKDHAWLKDEVSPISGEFVNSFSGWAATLVDTLDTLLIMGLDDEFHEALAAIEEIDFTTTADKTINVFETTIRYMGGFLAAYDLSDGKYPVLLKKAREVGELVYGAFDTPNRMQVSRWDWKEYVCAYVCGFFVFVKYMRLMQCRYLMGQSMRPSKNTLLAEVGSLSLEFTRLTQLTGDPKYFDAIQRVTDNLEEAQPKTLVPGLWPTMVDMENLLFQNTQFTLGGMADSTYEYLPKEHLLLGGRTDQYKRIYESAIDAVKKRLLFRPRTKDNADILFSGSLSGPRKVHEAQHLTCFIGGMFGIGAKIFEHSEDLKIARKLVDGCIWAYDVMETGLMPEIFKMSACDDMEECPWDEKKWLGDVAILSHAGHDEAVLRRFAADAHLPPGFTAITDARYILRCVLLSFFFHCV